MPQVTIICTDHTARDYATLLEAGVDPDTAQPREHAVPCATCQRPTFNLAAGCDAHYAWPARAVRAVTNAERAEAVR